LRSNRLSLVLALLLAVASASVAAAAGLEARLVAAKSTVGPHDDVVVRLELRNAGSQSVWVPRWQVPQGKSLDNDLFEISLDGQPVRYVGRVAKRAAARAGELVELKPGQSLRGRAELSAHYEMKGGGAYLIAYRLDLLDGVAFDALRDGSEELRSNEITVWRDAPFVDRGARLSPVEEMMRTFTEASLSTTGCTSSQTSAINSAVSAATTYSTGSKNYLNSKTYTTVGPRYTTWFGTPSSSNFNTVKNHFVAIEDAFLTKPVVVDCGCSDNYYAYVYKNQPYKIYVCNAFWSAPNTGTDSRGGTLVHEMSHFTVVADTDDWAYGQSACKKLAKRATKAIDNADSHEYFAENTPALN
jgi:peptidyl-Lys metalloendopeptidase